PGGYRRGVGVLSTIGDGLWAAFQMAWEVAWALVLGFALSGIVQAWIPRSRMERALGGRGPRTLALATGLGAASSSCSYAAVAIAKSVFQKGASLAAAMAFQFASTNLVFEIGIVIWVFIGWQFTAAEFAGGLILIVLMWIAIRLLVSVALGALVAVLSFVCSVGNVPLAAVLWAGGISFAGVIAFIYADLIIIPLVLIYSRYYGRRLTALLVGIMFAAMAAAALAVGGLLER